MFVVACLTLEYQRHEIAASCPGVRGEGICVLCHSDIEHGVGLWRSLPSAASLWLFLTPTMTGAGNGIYLGVFMFLLLSQTCSVSHHHLTALQPSQKRLESCQRPSSHSQLPQLDFIASLLQLQLSPPADHAETTRPLFDQDH